MTPTLAVSVTSFNNAITPKIAPVSWVTGDLIVVLGIISSNNAASLSTPTVSGLTFTSIDLDNTDGTHPWGGSWQATATSSGSGNISVSRSGGTLFFGFMVIKASSGTHDGIGTHTRVNNTSETASVTLVGPNSAVCELIADGGDGSPTGHTYVPSGATEPTGGSGADLNQYAWYSATWTGQSAGTASYGVNVTSSGGQYTKVIVEIKGPGGGGGGSGNTVAWLTA